MPDPVASSLFSPDFVSGGNDEPQACQATPGPEPSPAPSACLLPAASAEPASSNATSRLVRTFPRSEQPALLAPPLTPSSAASPTIFSLRPDQIDLQAGIPRIVARASLAGVQLSAGIDILNANAHVGSVNADGSRGENVGAGANLLGGELDIGYHGWSLTLGVAASLGGSISSGQGRDLDADGLQERCFALSLGPFTLGECDEL